MIIEVDGNQAGVRLDIFLSKKLGVSRSYIKNNIHRGVYILNKIKPLKVSYVLEGIEKINLSNDFEKALNDKESQGLGERTDQDQSSNSIVSTKADLDIVYEDSDILVINKPRGVAVEPNLRDKTNSLASHIKFYLQQKGEFNEKVMRSGIVHRIDKPAGGLLLVAKDPEVQEELFEVFKSRKVEKIYFANVKREVLTQCDKVKIGEKITLKGYIYRDEKNRLRRFFSETEQIRAGGRFSHSEFLFTSENSCYIKIYTGRPHQIRASLRHLGYIIVGDHLYRENKSSKIIDLFCVKLSFDLRRKKYGFVLDGHEKGIPL